jgi:Protein of unknown function (DUF2612).
MTDEIIHLDEMRERLPSHMRSGTQFDKLLQIFAERYQDIEDVFQDLLTNRAIDTAEGKQLDGLGQIIDLAREPGQSDVSYRLAIKSQFIVLSKSGSVEEVIDAYLKVTESATLEYTEIYPATFQLAALPTVDVTDPDIAEYINTTMQNIKPAGVNMILTTATGFTLSQYSEVDGSGNGPTDNDEGFGSSYYTQLEGGGLARVI